MANQKINQFVAEALFDPSTHDKRRIHWKKLYLVIDFNVDSDNNAIDYICYEITFNPKKALNTFDKVKARQISFNPKIIVYYTPPTFRFKSSSMQDRISEWFKFSYPNYTDIETPYTEQPQAKWIQTISMENNKDIFSSLDMALTMLHNNPQHWWSCIEETYSEDDFYEFFDDKKFEFVKSKDCVRQKLYSVVGVQEDSRGQLLVLTYDFKEAISKTMQSINHWGKNNIKIVCHYVPTDSKEIENWTDAEIDHLIKKYPDETYSYYELERFDLLT